MPTTLKVTFPAGPPTVALAVTVPRGIQGGWGGCVAGGLRTTVTPGRCGVVDDEPAGVVCPLDGVALGLLPAGVVPDDGVAAGVDDGVAAGVDDGVAAGVDDGVAAGVDDGVAAGVDDGVAAGALDGVAAGALDGVAAGALDGAGALD